MGAATPIRNGVVDEDNEDLGDVNEVALSSSPQQPP